MELEGGRVTVRVGHASQSHRSRYAPESNVIKPNVTSPEWDSIGFTMRHAPAHTDLSGVDAKEGGRSRDPSPDPRDEATPDNREFSHADAKSNHECA